MLNFVWNLDSPITGDLETQIREISKTTGDVENVVFSSSTRLAADVRLPAQIGKIDSRLLDLGLLND